MPEYHAHTVGRDLAELVRSSGPSHKKAGQADQAQKRNEAATKPSGWFMNDWFEKEWAREAHHVPGMSSRSM